MCSTLPVRGLFCCAFRLIVGIGKRRSGATPFISLFIYFPGLRQATFKPRVSARVCRAAIADLIPCPRMRIVNRYAVLYDQVPETADRHARPDLLRGALFAVMNGF